MTDAVLPGNAAIYQTGSGVRREDAGKDFDGGAFSGSVGADVADHFPVLNGEGNVIQSADLVIFPVKKAFAGVQKTRIAPGDPVGFGDMCDSDHGKCLPSVFTLADGCRKVGVALCSAVVGGVVEVDPQGFGERAWQICACGIHIWKGSSESESASVADVKSSDMVFASIAAAGGAEKTVKAEASEGNIAFTLDAGGTAETTKISWIAIRKN